MCVCVCVRACKLAHTYQPSAIRPMYYPTRHQVVVRQRRREGAGGRGRCIRVHSSAGHWQCWACCVNRFVVTPSTQRTCFCLTFRPAGDSGLLGLNPVSSMVLVLEWWLLDFPDKRQGEGSRHAERMRR